MSAGARGRDWWSLPKSERENVDPTADYVSADAQIMDTTGVFIKDYWESPEDRETVRDADSETTKKVIKALDRPRKVGKVFMERDGETATVGREPDTDDYLPKFEDDGGPAIPGKGEVGETCGDDLAMFCDGCGKTHVTGQTCGLSRCPRCWASWCRDLAVEQASRLAVTRAVRDANREDQQFFHHLAWSPPDEWALEAEDPLRRTKQAINEILDAMDLDAICLYHAWRGNQEDDDDRGEWARRLSEDMDWEEVRDELKFSPHFHIIAVGSHVPGGDLTKRVQEETGWSLHRILKGEDSNVSLYDNSDMVSAIEYSISHASLKRTPAGHNSVQMWSHGDIIGQKFVKESEMGPDEDPDEVDDLVIAEETEEEMDLLARAHAPLTLGVDLNDQICTEEFVNVIDRETGADRAGVRTLIDIGTGDTRQWTPASSASTGSSSGSSADGSSASTIATTSATTTEIDEIVHNREGDPGDVVETCQGRKLPIWEAPNYIGDSKWRESADHVDELDATWTDWKPRLEKMLDNFG